ncbi:MAG: glycosyltransferase [Prolixibacteraceae bacterium]
MFADRYLQKNKKDPLISKLPADNTGIIVVIPCFREPEILKTLDSLRNCRLSRKHIEVLVIINHAENASEEIKKYNQKTKAETENWISKNQNQGMGFYAIGPVELQKKWAGAGLARKTGMDEAVRRFNLLEKPRGIIVSLDADTVVEPNYLVEIENHFRENQKHVGTTISVRHQTDGLSTKHREGVELYEKYQYYYKESMRFTCYPHAMFTVGSAFAVTAEAYVKRGGMNRRQAGEDFYFLQGLAQLGAIGEIATTTVHPSARLSDRVPFGTGPILQKWMKGEEDLTKTYNLNAFADVKAFFERKENFYLISKEQYFELIAELPASVKAFLLRDNFWKELEDLNKNCSTPETFASRFFQKFNAFKILKFLNFAHEKFYEKEDLKDQLKLLKNIHS